MKRQPLISRNGTEPKIPWHPKLIRPRHLSGLNTCTHSHTHSGPGVTIESAYQQLAGERQNVGLMFNLSPSVLCCAFAAQKGTHAVQSYQQILPAKTCRLPVPVGVGRSDKSKLTSTHTHTPNVGVGAGNENVPTVQQEKVRLSSKRGSKGHTKIRYCIRQQVHLSFGQK